MVAFTASLSARSVNFIPACQGHLRMSFRRWMSTLTHGSLYCLFGWWPHLAWQWSRTLISLWLPSHQCILWDLVICCFLEWDAWSLTQFCPPAILDGAFPRFLAGVSRRDAAVGLGTSLITWFVWALSAGILTILKLGPSNTCPVPVCLPLSITASWSRLWGCSVQFSSVQDGIYALYKVNVRSTPSLTGSPALPLKRFQCSSDWRSGPFSFFLGRSLVLPLSIPLLQAISGVISLALCPQVMSQTSQHFRASKPLQSKPLVTVVLPTSLSARSFPFTSACSG